MIKTLYGPMGSGKTKRLIDDYNKIFFKDKVVVFKPQFDDRYGLGEVVDREKRSVPAVDIPDLLQIEDYINENIKRVFIDEINFFESTIDLEKGIDQIELERRRLETIKTILRLSSKGINFNMYGLNLTAELIPYGMTPYFMAISDEIERLKAECADCGNEAMYTYYLPENKTVINKIGDTDYVALCLQCYFERIEKRHTKELKKD